MATGGRLKSVLDNSNELDDSFRPELEFIDLGAVVLGFFKTERGVNIGLEVKTGSLEESGRSEATVVDEAPGGWDLAGPSLFRNSKVSSEGGLSDVDGGRLLVEVDDNAVLTELGGGGGGGGGRAVVANVEGGGGGGTLLIDVGGGGGGTLLIDVGGGGGTLLMDVGGGGGGVLKFNGLAGEGGGGGTFVPGKDFVAVGVTGELAWPIFSSE